MVEQIKRYKYDPTAQEISDICMRFSLSEDYLLELSALKKEVFEVNISLGNKIGFRVSVSARTVREFNSILFKEIALYELKSMGSIKKS